MAQFKINEVAIGKVNDWKLGGKPFEGHGSGMTNIAGGLGSGDALWVDSEMGVELASGENGPTIKAVK